MDVPFRNEGDVEGHRQHPGLAEGCMKQGVKLRQQRTVAGLTKGVGGG